MGLSLYQTQPHVNLRLQTDVRQLICCRHANKHAITGIFTTGRSGIETIVVVTDLSAEALVEGVGEIQSGAENTITAVVGTSAVIIRVLILAGQDAS